MGAPPKWGLGLEKEKDSNNRVRYFHWHQACQKENFVNFGLRKKGDACMFTTCC